MQSCEPVHHGLFHVAHWLSIPTARTRFLLERVQFWLLPVTNPDGLALGYSVTNSVLEVPKFGINDLVAKESGLPDARPAPLETAALWALFREQRFQASCEVHAHFTHPGFSRSVGMPAPATLPAALHARGSALEAAFAEAYGTSGGAEKVSETESHSDGSFNRLVLIDHTKPEEDVYGTNHVAGLGQIVTWLQAVPASIDAHKADVREMAETLAMAVIGAEPPEPRPAL